MILILLFVILLCYLIGLIVTVFFSHDGWLLSIAAFFVMCIFMLLFSRFKESGRMERPPWLPLPFINQARRYIRVAIPILGVLILLGLIAMFSQQGVCDTDSLPLIAHREHYLLNNHGHRTEVSAGRYYLAGFGFLVGWNSMMFLATLEALDQQLQRMLKDGIS